MLLEYNILKIAQRPMKSIFETRRELGRNISSKFITGENWSTAVRLNCTLCNMCTIRRRLTVHVCEDRMKSRTEEWRETDSRTLGGPLAPVMPEMNKVC